MDFLIILMFVNVKDISIYTFQVVVDMQFASKQCLIIMKSQNFKNPIGKFKKSHSGNDKTATLALSSQSTVTLTRHFTLVYNARKEILSFIFPLLSDYSLIH